MVDLVIASVAEGDYAEALTWYANRNMQVAEEFEAAFERALRTISLEPKRFPFCDNQHRYFLMQRFPYQIIYRDSQQQIVVISVAHTSRKPDFWKSR